jgi:hypothetical protein
MADCVENRRGVTQLHIVTSTDDRGHHVYGLASVR